MNQKEDSAKVEAAIDWIERMIAANPWAEPWRHHLLLQDWRGQKYEFSDEDEGSSWTTTTSTGEHSIELVDEYVAARRKVCLDRWRAGPDVWNEWASPMANVREALVDAKLWRRHGISPDNRFTGVYDALAATDFSSAKLSPDAPFTDFLFPGRADFKGAVFGSSGPASVAAGAQDEITGEPDFTRAVFQDRANVWSSKFHGGIADFSQVTFWEDADFSRAQFTGGTAVFHEALFDGDANFVKANFFGGVLFDAAKFHGEANFTDVEFNGHARFFATHFGERPHSGKAQFQDAQFKGEAHFRAAKFNSDVAFTRVIFTKRASFEVASDLVEVAVAKGDTATEFRGKVDFTEATFAGSASFAGAECSKEATFRSIDSRIDFSLADAKFGQVPGFIGAQFRGMLHLDNVVTPKHRFFGWTFQSDAPARFRDLKRRAAEAGDHDRELEFFAQEVRTSRFHASGLPAFVPRVWERRFWFGLLFGTFSDFGRSLWRPFLSWSMIFVGFSAFYLGDTRR